MKLSIFFLQFIFFFILYSCNSEAGKQPESTKQQNANTNESAEKQDKADEKVILFYGNSLTAGFGLDKDQAFPALIQDRLDSLGFEYTVVNGGLSGETSSGGKERISWVLRSPVDIFILELGPNDMLRGLDLAETKQNLAEIIEAVKAKNSEAKIIIAGMTAPPNMGQEYVNKFTEMYPALADEYNAGLIPFLLEGVAGNPELNLEDGKHPNAEGQQIVAKNVWEVLKDYL